MVRLCGADAWALVRRCVDGRSGPLPEAPPPGRLFRGTYRDGAEGLDEVIVVRFEPEEGQGEVVDISCHGGVRVVERILLSLTRQGAILSDGGGAARLGWTARSAVEGEALDLLASATTRRGALFLMVQSRLLPAELARIAGLAESGGLSAAKRALRTLVERTSGGRYLVEPAEVALVGPVNAGKSLLANTLAAREAVVVTDRPGTTRDWVAVPVAIEGVPVTLLDTAGGRPTNDDLERQAIRRSSARAHGADVHLLVMDATCLPSAERLAAWMDTLAPKECVVVLNKIDLDGAAGGERVRSLGIPEVVEVSALGGDGTDVLGRSILDRLGVRGLVESEPAVFSSGLLGRLEKLVNCPAASQTAWADKLRAILLGKCPA